MKERILDINPNAYVETYECFFLPENSGKFDFSEYDYVVDAVDTVTAKLEIIMKAKEAEFLSLALWVQAISLMRCICCHGHI